MKKTDLKLFSFLVLCIILLGLASAIQQVHIHFIPGPKPTEAPAVIEKAKLTYVPQFVLISFDGSKSIDIWKDIRAFKDEMKAASTTMNVTHYINTAYFLTNETRYQYQGPEHEAGKTNIGIADGVEDIRARINEVNASIASGDEIAVHTTGHFSGLHWTSENWQKELVSFNDILFGLDKMYPDAHLPKLNLATSSIIGFRAPYLDHDAQLYTSLHTLPNYRYDSTEVAVHADNWPFRDSKGLWHIPLGSMNRSGRNILAMDYNWYLQDSDTKNILKKGTPEWQAVYDKTLDGLRGYFKHNYDSNHAPVLVGYHFEKWNDSVYWEVLKTFAHEVCGKPQVQCGTFKELVDYLDEYGLPNDAKKMQVTAAAGEVVSAHLVDGEHNE